MPGKSRHGKGKHYRATKKSKAMSRQATTPAQPAAAASLPRQAQAAVPQAGQPAALAAKKAIDEYTYVGGELRRIAILSVIIIVVLIVLSFVLA